MNFGIHIALPDDAPRSLLQVAGTPGAIQIVTGYQPVLDVGTGSHFRRAAKQHAHLTGAYLRKEFFLFCFRVSIVDKGDFLPGNAAGNELIPNILIHGEVIILGCAEQASFRHIFIQRKIAKFIIQIRHRRFFSLCCPFFCYLLRRFSRRALGSGNIAENELGQPVRRSFLPNTEHVVDALIDLAPRIVWQQGIDHSLIQPQLSSVAGHFQHIVLPGINPGVNGGSAAGKLLDHGFLVFRRLSHHRFKLHLRRGQVQLIRRFYISNLLEHRHKLREIEEFGEAGAGTIAGSFRGQLDGRDGFPEGTGPAIEVGHVVSPQGIILQIPLHGIKLGHGVGNGRTRGKHHTTPAGDFVHVPAFQKHIRGLLRFAGGKARHIAHFRQKEHVFVVVRFVHEQPVHTQLLESHNVVFFLLCLQFPQATFQLLLGALQLLDGKLFAAGHFQFLDAFGQFVDLILEQSLLSFHGNGNALKLGVADDHGVVIPGGDSGAELFSVGFFKIPFSGHKNFGRRIQP